MYPVRPFSTRSLTSTQDTTANNDEIICAADNQLGLHPIIMLQVPLPPCIIELF